MKGLNTVNFTQSELDELTAIADSKNTSVEQLIQEIVVNRLNKVCGTPQKSGDVIQFNSPCKLPDRKA
jgi:hypothetical protein